MAFFLILYSYNNVFLKKLQVILQRIINKAKYKVFIDLKKAIF
jgi:flagellar motor protein MotB